jgi:hypothetical protein
LTLWNCNIGGEVYNAAGEKQDNTLLMVYYFNLGLDATIGLEVEQNRTKKRCCNYIVYAYMSAKNFLFKPWYRDARA